MDIRRRAARKGKPANHKAFGRGSQERDAAASPSGRFHAGDAAGEEAPPELLKRGRNSRASGTSTGQAAYRTDRRLEEFRKWRRGRALQ